MTQKSYLDVAHLPCSKLGAIQSIANVDTCITIDRNVVEGLFWCLLWGFRVCQKLWWHLRTVWNVL